MTNSREVVNMFRLSMLLVVFTTGLVFAQEKKEYSCSIRVDNPTIESSKTEKEGKGRKSTVVETTTRAMHYPVKVSFRGKTLPTAGIRLNCFFSGRKDGQNVVLGKRTVDVKLDEKGDFKTEIVSDPAVWTETKSRVGRGRNRNTKSVGSGMRLGGCIIQLIVDGQVERVYTSKPTWAKLAKQYPLPESEILKIR